MHSFRADSAGIFQHKFDHRSLEDHDSDIEFMRPILDHGSIQSSVDALGAGINALKAQAHDQARVSALNRVACGGNVFVSTFLLNQVQESNGCILKQTSPHLYLQSFWS